MTVFESRFSWRNLAGAACAVFGLLIAGCGGGGGGGGVESAQVSTEDPPASTGNPPVISGTPQSSITVDLVYSFIPAFNDPDGDNLVFNIVNPPSWASFDAGSGALVGQPGANDVGVNTGIVISVSDGTNSVSLPTFDIEVLSTSTGAALLSWSAPTQNADNSALLDLAGYKVHYGKTSGNYPNVKTIDGVGSLSVMVENLSPDTWFFVVTAFDGSGNESVFSNVVSKNVL